MYEDNYHLVQKFLAHLNNVHKHNLLIHKHVLEELKELLESSTDMSLDVFDQRLKKVTSQWVFQKHKDSSTLLMKTEDSPPSFFPNGDEFSNFQGINKALK